MMMTMKKPIPFPAIGLRRERLPNPLAAAWRSLAALDLRLANAMRHRRDLQVLQSMSERELADLGLGRSDIPALMDPASDWRREPF